MLAEVKAIRAAAWAGDGELSPRAQREREHFDRLVQQTGDVWWGNRTIAGALRLQRRAAIVECQIGSASKWRVLECGGGTGAFTEPLLAALPDLDLTVCEISTMAAAVCRAKFGKLGNVSVVNADLLDLPDEPKFMAVVGNGFLHHAPLGPALAKIRSILVPGGRAIFFEPNLLNPHVYAEKRIPWLRKLLGNSPDEQAYSRHRLRAAFAAAGFASVSVTPIDFLHPHTPPRLIPIVGSIGRLLERVPVLRELSGSLCVLAQLGWDAK
jgi:SAM-dependent methyltransferase